MINRDHLFAQAWPPYLEVKTYNPFGLTTKRQVTLSLGWRSSGSCEIAGVVGVGLRSAILHLKVLKLGVYLRVVWRD